MSGPGNGLGESVRKFSDDVDAAVGRARRASAEPCRQAPPRPVPEGLRSAGRGRPGTRVRPGAQ